MGGQMTGSVTRGDFAPGHDDRSIYKKTGRWPGNINPEGRVVELLNEPIELVYEEEFGDAVREYNAMQVEKGHPERQKLDYFGEIKKSKQSKIAYEYVIQVGNRESHPEDAEAVEMLSEWLDAFKDRVGRSFAIVQAIVHLDESTPHMHLSVVPVAESTRGVRIQNSQNKALQQAGFKDWPAMIDFMHESLTEVMKTHGIERIEGKGEKRGHISAAQYRSEARSRERQAAAEQAAKEASDARQAQDDAAKQAEERVQAAEQKVASLKKTEEQRRNTIKALEGARYQDASGKTHLGVRGLQQRIEDMRGEGWKDKAGEHDGLAKIERGRQEAQQKADELNKRIEDMQGDGWRDEDGQWHDGVDRLQRQIDGMNGFGFHDADDEWHKGVAAIERDIRGLDMKINRKQEMVDSLDEQIESRQSVLDTLNRQIQEIIEKVATRAKRLIEKWWQLGEWEQSQDQPRLDAAVDQAVDEMEL